MPEHHYRLEMTGINKRFGSTVALSEVQLQVASGEVHALVGENGAGKSTLMKILSGAEQADSGTMVLNGISYSPSGPHKARELGVAMIYQELALAPDLDVESNILLGIEEHRWGFLRQRKNRQRVEQALALLNLPRIRPNTKIRSLSPGACQLVEVARALVTEAKVIVFDEPTSSLTHKDTKHLFDLIHRLRDRGVSILFISHFLEEIRRIADRFTVLRDGRSVAAGSVNQTGNAEMIQHMVGRDLTELFPRIPHETGEPLLVVEGLQGESQPEEVDFTVHQGEILGIFGLVGAGRTETLRAIFGLDPTVEGNVWFNRQNATGQDPTNMIALGMGLLSEDRKSEGLALPQTIADNLTYSRLSPYVKNGFLHLGKRRKEVRKWLWQLKVRCRESEQPAGELSGGNQQKVALARLLHQESAVLLLDEPTRGVDVGSKAEIYRLIGELACQGKAILFVSSYLPELLGVCDTLAVMTRGTISPVRPVADWTEESIMEFATGGET